MSQTINVQGARAQEQLGLPVPVDATNHASGSNAAAVVTLAADATRGNILAQIFCSFSATPTATATIKVEDGSGSTVWQQALPAAGPFTFTLDPPIIGTSNTAMIITLAAGGTGITGYLDVNARKHQ